MLGGDPSGSFLTLIFWDVCQRTPTSGCSVIQDLVKEAFHSLIVPQYAGKGQGGIHHQQWPENKW